MTTDVHTDKVRLTLKSYCIVLLPMCNAADYITKQDLFHSIQNPVEITYSRTCRIEALLSHVNWARSYIHFLQAHPRVQEVHYADLPRKPTESMQPRDRAGRDINNATVSKLSTIEESLESLKLLIRGDPIHRVGVSTSSNEYLVESRFPESKRWVRASRHLVQK